ncbi:MAG: nuclear transport factor 2 family protein [Chitinophagaceae bacterium]|nr:nuclear transport factor 2 family protein [Chitinophagaceae bacterium]
MKQIFNLSIAITALLIVGCNNKPTTSKNNSSNLITTELRQLIETKNKQFGKAHVLRDTAFLNNIFTETARIFAPNANIISGRSAIASINWEYVNFDIHEFNLETTALYGSGEYLINEGNYNMHYGTDSTLEKGKFIFVWKMINGDWKLDADIWNSSMPLTPNNEQK